MVVFGGTGDLTHRKLIPAIYNLEVEGLLPKNFAVVAIGRRDLTDEDYRNKKYEGIKDFSRFKLDEAIWNKVKDRIYYKKLDFTNAEAYNELAPYLKGIDTKHNTGGNRIYYLAVAPEFFGNIVENLDRAGINHIKNTWQRVVIEKPFGRNLESAEELNTKIVNVFKEENTYRIDHYLGKEMLQNIMVIRFANMLFEPLWNNRYIDNVQITSCETVGVGSRGGYYEKSGAMRDMIQSHMLQLLSLIAMDKPSNLDPNTIRDEKVKVINALKELSEEEVKENVVRGQYGANNNEKGYREEERVAKDSETETYVALKAEVENARWAGVPFYIRTGKKMPKKSTEVIIQFKLEEDRLYFNEDELLPNTLVIRVQPMEGVFLQFNAKEPGTRKKIAPVHMDFCQNCQVGINSPEAYERLLYDVMRGDATLFARWDEVSASWKYVDGIIEAWKNDRPQFPNYKSGTWGPKEALDLLDEEDRKWLEV
ncbi:glucose-6-phosphate dehydrogenase [Haloplasma contractile]